MVLSNLKNKTTSISILLLMFILNSCDPNPKKIKYSFFVAGHTYGNPMNHQLGLHPPFVEAINYLNEYPNLSLGILTGDIVPKPNDTYWNAAISDINKINYPIHIAAGNHDRGDEFEKRFGEYFYHFKNENDLFIILSPTNWNIENEQKEYLIQTIQNNNKKVKNIFIFCHELIWWSPENKFKGVEINYRPHYPGQTNFWNEIYPFLDSLNNQVTIFAGDLGCTEKVSPYTYYKQKNITLIGSGMGGRKEDNILIVEVDKNDEVNYRIIGLNETPYKEIIDIEEYTLPSPNAN